MGRDVDLVAIVAQAEEPFEAHEATWDTTPLPVPADLTVYYRERMERSSNRAAALQNSWSARRSGCPDLQDSSRHPGALDPQDRLG